MRARDLDARVVRKVGRERVARLALDVEVDLAPQDDAARVGDRLPVRLRGLGLRVEPVGEARDDVDVREVDLEQVLEVLALHLNDDFLAARERRAVHLREARRREWRLVERGEQLRALLRAELARDDSARAPRRERGTSFCGGSSSMTSGLSTSMRVESS